MKKIKEILIEIFNLFFPPDIEDDEFSKNFKKWL
jgi:hypothetical protein